MTGRGAQMDRPCPLVHSSGYPHDHCFQSSTEHPVAATTKVFFLFLFLTFWFNWFCFSLTHTHIKFDLMNQVLFLYNSCSYELIKLSTVLGSHCPVLDATSPTQTLKGRMRGHTGEYFATDVFSQFLNYIKRLHN